MAPAKHDQHTSSSARGREMDLGTPHLTSCCRLSQAADGSKTSLFMEGDKWSYGHSCWCSHAERGLQANSKFPVLECKMVLEKWYLICRQFSESFDINFKTLGVSSTDIHELKML